MHDAQKMQRYTLAELCEQRNNNVIRKATFAVRNIKNIPKSILNS